MVLAVRLNNGNHLAIPVNDGLLQIFDVEHGACALFTSACTTTGYKRFLIDCGHNATTGWYPGEHLQRLGVSKLEHLVITNYDEDHVSGYPDFLRRGIQVDWMVRNSSVAPGTIKHLKSEYGMGPGIEALVNSLNRFSSPLGAVGPPRIPGVQWETFRNAYPVFADENNLSLVLYLDIRGIKFLFPGDMECAGFEYLLKTNSRFRSITGSIDVLIASHHGRDSGICEAMFDSWSCKPQLIVISDDYKRYDTQETASYYASKCAGIQDYRGCGPRKVLTTRSDSEIDFSFVGGRCIVS